jgi:hypothetical protein
MSFLDTFWGGVGCQTVVEEEIIEMPVVQAERDVKPGLILSASTAPRILRW